MAQSGKGSNSAGRVITVKDMAVTLTDTNGCIFKMVHLFGSLSLSIRSENGVFGYLHETLYLTLQLSRGGNILGKWSLS